MALTLRRLEASAWARSARAGVAVWWRYGCVELAFLGVVSYLAVPAHLHQTLHLPLTLLCAAVYALAGIAIGVAASLVPTFARSAVSASLPVAFLVNVWAAKDAHRAAVMTAIALVPLALAALLRDVWPRLRGRDLFAHGWTPSLILMGGYWIGYLAPGIWPRWQRETAALAYAVAIAAGALLTHSARKALEQRLPTGMAQRAALHLALWAGLVAASAIWTQQPLVQPATHAAAAARSAPPIVLVTLDTVRADHLSIDGYSRATSPHLAALARDAMNYTNAIAAGNMTLTSHASLFTGAYASRHGAHPPASPLGAGSPVLAEMLARHGYRTSAVVSNTGYVTHAMGLARGFGYFDQRNAVRLAAVTARGRFIARPTGTLRGAVGSLAARLAPGYRPRPYYRDAAEISDAAIEQIEILAAGDRPFFLFVNYMDAHMPYLPPPPYHALFPGRDPAYSWAAYQQLRADLAHGFREIEHTEREHLISQYDGAIAYQDAEIARVIARLKELRLYEQAMIIVTSDHGEAFGRRGVLEHGATLYQEQIHVPLVIKYPGGPQPRVIDALAAGVDVMPTVLDMLGLAIPPEVQGRSLLRGSDELALSESFPNQPSVPASALERTLLTPNHLKLIASERKIELFDLAHDPGEDRDLERKDPGRVAELAHALHEQLPVGDGDPSAGEVEIDHQTLQQLRALGYL